MKIHRSVYIIILLMAGYLLPGMISNSISFKNEISIDKPSSKVFLYLIFPGHLKLWLDDFEKAEMIGNLIKDGMGNQFIVTYKLMGRRTNFMVEITHFKNNREISFVAHPPNMEVLIDMKFIEKDDSSLLISSTFTGESLLSRSALFFIKPWLRHDFEKDLKQLKSLMETED